MAKSLWLAIVAGILGVSIVVFGYIFISRCLHSDVIIPRSYNLIIIAPLQSIIIVGIYVMLLALFRERRRR